MPQHDLHYIEEFLYRGRRKGDERPTAWHLILGVEGVDPMGRPHASLPIMSTEQAIQTGWGIPEIVSEINEETLADLEAERARTRQLSQDVDNLTATLNQTRGIADGLAKEKAKLITDLEAERSDRAALQKRIDELNANLATD